MSRADVRRLVRELRESNPAGILSRRRAADLIEAALAEPEGSQTLRAAGGIARSSGDTEVPNMVIALDPPPPRIVFVPVPRRR